MCSHITTFWFSFIVIAVSFVSLTTEKQLPSLDNPKLRWMIEHDSIIVDKTEYLNLMLESHYTFFFLSRPRRFGKSFLIDIMNEFFNGEKKLFENTYIYNKYPDPWLKYPVIRLDFTDGISSSSLVEFRKDIVMMFQRVAELYNIYSIYDHMSPELALVELIETLKNNTGLKVVILLDEYNAPYATSYSKPYAADILNSLTSFFRVLKAQISNIHFFFFTGASTMAISEFMTVTTSLDLSLMPEYAAILGFTDDDLDTHFEWAVQQVAEKQNKSKENIRTEMRMWHNGFQFAGTGEQIYNPCSVISYLGTKGSEKLFWSKSGGFSTVLKNKFLQFPRLSYNYVLKFATSHSLCPVKIGSPGELKPLKVPKSILSGDVDEAETSIAALQAILFHGGYLTIDKEICGKTEPIYYLRFSNLEVEYDYIKRLSRTLLANEKTEYQTRITDLSTTLENYEWEDFINELSNLFAQLPYFINTAKMAKNIEAMYQFQMYIYMIGAGFDIDLEVMTNTGRADLVILTESTTFIFETKLKKNKENPLDQCLKKYVQKFINSEQVVLCIGLQFSQKAEIVAWGVANFSTNGKLSGQYGEIKLSTTQCE